MLKPCPGIKNKQNKCRLENASCSWVPHIVRSYILIEECSWLMTDMGRPRPLCGGAALRLVFLAFIEKQAEQASKQRSYTASALVLASRSLSCFNSCLVSLSDGLWSYMQGRPFPLQSRFCLWCLYHRNRKQTREASKMALWARVLLDSQVPPWRGRTSSQKLSLSLIHTLWQECVPFSPPPKNKNKHIKMQ